MSNHEAMIIDWDDQTTSDEESVDDNTDPEFVDNHIVEVHRREYRQAQINAQSRVTTLEPASSHSERPKRLPARPALKTSRIRNAFTATVSSPSTVHEDDSHFSDDRDRRAQSSTTGRISSPKSAAISAARSAASRPELWRSREALEARPHSWNNPFRPTLDDIQRWISDKAPAKCNMRTNRAFTPMKPSNNIVEEYLSPDESIAVDYRQFKVLNDEQKQDIIAREAEEYGMEKPQGYSVSFHYNPHVEYHHFGSSHPMKPWRLTLTKQLVLSYGLEYTMDLYEPRPATFDEIAIFHDREYTQFLKEITPQNMKQHEEALINFGFAGESNDCPVFEGLWNYVCLYGGASMHAAQNLLNNQSDIAINWSGGLHHARKGAASGFCYVNDIVLAIQHLLTQHQRVLYIDIDVHHGDGVEAAFESTDRVFTLSYHKYGPDRINGWPFFPGTGNISDTGPADPTNRGKGHALNIPIEDGIDDDQYKWLFKTVTGAVVEKYRPTAIVLQSGADSLGGDRLGRFNLNIKAHGFCVETVKNYGLPLMLIGGGGYTPRNVARTWCHETSVCVGAQLHNDLPTHIPYIQAFQGEENGGGILYPDLHNTKRHENLNETKKLHKIVAQAMENLRYLEGAPSVVVNTMGISEEQLMKIREEIDAEIQEEKDDKHHHNIEKLRRTRERNIGGRGERGLR